MNKWNSAYLWSVLTMQLCSLGQGTVSPWSIVPRCPRVLLILPTMSDSFPSVPSLAVPATRHCWKHLQHPGTARNNDPWGHCPLSQGAKLHRLDRSLCTPQKQVSHPWVIIVILDTAYILQVCPNAWPF